MIELTNVSRWYGQVIGLNDVSCTIGPGVTALLGMNGAGKSTLMRLVTGQMQPTTGEISVLGHRPFANPDVFRLIGYCPEIDNFYEHRTGRDFVRMMGRYHGYSAKEANSRAENVLEQVNMADRANGKIKGYSKGMRQRIKLAQAMIHDPKIILLDEPLNGLDPVGRRDFISLLGALAIEGKTIMVSSHILFEVEQMTRSILLLHRGRLLATGDLTVIRTLIDKYPHRVRIESSQSRKLAARLAGLPYVLSLEFMSNDKGIELQVKDPDKFYDLLPDLSLIEELDIKNFSSPDNNLESIFRYLVQS